ncbi:hypothetical protein SH528x_007098 [Novipirellula sp. SH528]
MEITLFAIQRGIAVRNDAGHCDTIDSLADVGTGRLGRGELADEFASEL